MVKCFQKIFDGNFKERMHIFYCFDWCFLKSSEMSFLLLILSKSSSKIMQETDPVITEC